METKYDIQRFFLEPHSFAQNSMCPCCNMVTFALARHKPAHGSYNDIENDDEERTEYLIRTSLRSNLSVKPFRDRLSAERSTGWAMSKPVNFCRIAIQPSTIAQATV